MEFILKIKMDNEAFEDDCELSRILHKIANDLAGNNNDIQTGSVFDINGNKVGSYEISEEQRTPLKLDPETVERIKEKIKVHTAGEFCEEGM